MNNDGLSLAVAAPLAGQLAFAGVFAALILWLLLIPGSRLTEASDEPGTSKPFWKQARTWAIGIAVIQMLIYLFW